jgi:hypothetical protein
VQLQNAKQRFEAKGIKVAAISYDSPAILKDFAERHKVDFPLLSDPKSEIITSFGVLNADATGMTKGMALPGYFYIEASGVIREKYFEAKYANRFTANNVMLKLFPELAEGVSQKLDAPHLGLELTQSDRVAAPGSRVILSAQVTLPKDVHVYAPGVKGYIPIQLEIVSSPEFEVVPAVYPRSQELFLPAIKEKVPVFEGKFRIASDVRISAGPAMMKLVGDKGTTITIAGLLKYQACDRKICYVPASVPVSWKIEVAPFDLQRSPEAIRHK